jgi:uncharacterized protein (UPF0335 family)
MNDGSNSAASLLAFVERVERINEEIKACQNDRKDIIAEATLAGYDAKILRRVVRDRQQDPRELDEFEQMVKTYKEALRE